MIDRIERILNDGTTYFLKGHPGAQGGTRHSPYTWLHFDLHVELIPDVLL
jgi:hypothetical protein